MFEALKSYGWQPGQSGNPGGIPSAKKRMITNLAAQLRQECDVVDIASWLRSIWLDGKDPLTGDSIATDVKVRMEALRIILDRGWGQAAQHVIIEAQVQQLQTADVIDLPPELGDVRARRQGLRSAGVKTRVLDVEALERNEPSLADVMPEDDGVDE